MSCETHENAEKIFFPLKWPSGLSHFLSFLADILNWEVNWRRCHFVTITVTAFNFAQEVNIWELCDRVKMGCGVTYRFDVRWGQKSVSVSKMSQKTFWFLNECHFVLFEHSDESVGRSTELPTKIHNPKYWTDTFKNKSSTNLQSCLSGLILPYFWPQNVRSWSLYLLH